jgi:methyltransferase (TIGR00027 family)
MASVLSDYCDTELPDNVRWEESKRLRYNCELATSLLREQVPVLEFVEWKVSLIEPGRVHTVLPLNWSSTNEHCTHQASLIFLAADYTGGIALASLIPHWPVIGIHPVAPGEKPIAMWLVKGEIKFFRPSVGCLEISAEVDPGRYDRVRSRHAQGKTVLETLTIHFRNAGVEVGEASMTYYARQSDKLRTDGSDPDKVNVLYQHKLVSSAELIAGMRARESGGLFEDPFAARIAGEHGAALAARFSKKSPQHGPMIAARTRHLDLQILEYVRNGGRDLVLLGAGYDMRPFRLNLPAGTRVYELDFPTVLADRRRRLDDFGVGAQDGVTRIQVPIDLRSTTVANALEGIVDSTSPIFIAWEGMSMYFEEAEVRAMLAGMAPLLRNNRSRLWLDLVDERAIAQPDIFPEVKAFIRRIQMLGEPFVFGVESVKEFMESNGFQCRETVCSDVYLADHTDPVYSLYHFCIASAEAVPAIGATAVEEPSWTAHPAHSTPPLAASAEKPVGYGQK